VNGAALNLQRCAISRSGEKATQGLVVLISDPNVSIQGPRKITPLKVDASVTMTTLHDQTGVSVHRNCTCGSHVDAAAAKEGSKA
jgi:hypothetical protein